ncbi:acyl carrier protein [Spirosoma arcticum]
MNTTLRQPTRSAADRIRHLLIEFRLPVSILTDEAHFTRDLGLDAVDRINLLIRVEDEFGIRITDRDWLSLGTIDALTEYLLVEEGIGTIPRHSQPLMIDYSVCCN